MPVSESPIRYRLVDRRGQAICHTSGCADLTTAPCAVADADLPIAPSRNAVGCGGLGVRGRSR